MPSNLLGILRVVFLKWRAYVSRNCKKAHCWRFAHLDQGDYEYALSGIGTTIEHQFGGNHCLGRRTSTRAMRLWFQRLFRLFPNLQFEIHSISVSGFPWNTTAVAEWTDRATSVDGSNYVNYGVHVIQMPWGKVVSIDAYLDTQVLTETLNRMVDRGIEEAKAPPIIG